jgi:peroxiredoxin
MKASRWALAAAAAIGLGLAAVPFLPVDRDNDWSEASAAGTCAANPKRAPEFTLKDVDGKDVKLSDYKGRVVLLNFWATWCGPCKYEIPMFVQLQQQYKDQGLVFLGISVDDPIDALKPFMARMKINYPILVGLDREDVAEAYGPMMGIPVTFAIARDGTICTRYFGLRSKDQFERDIKALL